MIVYRLNISDDSYNGFVLADENQDTGFLRFFDGRPFTSDESPPFSLIPNPDWPEAPLPDWTLLYGPAVPVLPEKAYAALSDLITPCGQMFYAGTGPLRLWIANITKVIDCLDQSQSKIEYAITVKKEKYVREVRRYHLKPPPEGFPPFFKLPEFPLTKLYATEEVRQRVIENNLTGTRFVQVWPPPDPQIERQKYLEKHLARKKKKEQRF